MTKKHYEAIASIMRAQIHSASTHVRKDHCEIEAYADTSTCYELANYFERDNPLFKRDKFLQACGIE